MAYKPFKLLILVVLVMSISGCGKDSKGSADQENDENITIDKLTTKDSDITETVYYKVIFDSDLVKPNCTKVVGTGEEKKVLKALASYEENLYKAIKDIPNVTVELVDSCPDSYKFIDENIKEFNGIGLHVTSFAGQN